MAVGNPISAGLRTALLIGLVGSPLAGCSKKPQVDAEAPNSQLVAKVGNEVITVPELDNEFRLANVPNEMRKDPATIRRVVGELVARKYLVGQALEAKLDREPTVLLDILRSKEIVLANAVLARDVTTKSSSISKSDIDNYIANNPQKFAKRQLLSVDEISVPLNAISQPLLDATKEMNTLEEVDQKLRAMGVQHGRAGGEISSGDVPQELLDKVSSIPDEIFFIRSGGNGVFFKVLGQEARPLDGEAAVNLARNYIRQGILKSEIDMTTVTAKLGAKYEGQYSNLMTKDADQPNSK
jgi:EpsD family peptidyl-prolyl cis-trans isomerase